MYIRFLFIALFSFLLFSQFAQAQNAHDHQHGSESYHSFILEIQYGSGNGGDSVAAWEFSGWAGTDENKLWLKSEGENVEGEIEEAEFQALYSRNVSEFWDAQAGIRHDTRPLPLSYFALGFEGLAPYFLETQAHVFLSEEGDVSFRLKEEKDILISQRFILMPYAELNMFAQDVENQDVGAGFSDVRAGLKSRYEFGRKLAPYLDVHYDRKLGETSAIARKHGEARDDLVWGAGLRLMF